MSIKSKTTKKTLALLEEITGSPLTLGELIKSIRLGEEATQVTFAKLLNMSKQQLCDIEHERKSVSPKLAAEYAKKLGYSEKQFVQLSIQDELSRAGLNFDVEIREAA